MHDNGLAKALTDLGEQILLVPMYTPLRTDEENVSLDRIFFGGVNVYLQQHAAMFRHTPWFVDRWLDSPRLLDWLSRRSAGMEVSKLGALTVSTLQGEQGRQRKEIEKLIRWLESDGRPEIVHLSNALLLGAARQLRSRLKVPIVCSLAGEDVFLEQLKEPHYSQARFTARVRGQCGYVSWHTIAILPISWLIIWELTVTGSKLSVTVCIWRGIVSDGLGGRSTVTIGFFSRIAPEKGLHLLVEAFAKLSADPALPPLRLKAAGYKSAGDEPYFQAVVLSASPGIGIVGSL